MYPNPPRTRTWEATATGVDLRGVQCRLTASTGLGVDRRHTPRSCGYDVGAVTLKSKEATLISFFSYIFLWRYYQRGLQAHLLFGLHFVIFAWERHWQTASHLICSYLVAMATRSTHRPVDAVSWHWTPLWDFISLGSLSEGQHIFPGASEGSTMSLEGGSMT